MSRTTLYTLVLFFSFSTLYSQLGTEWETETIFFNYSKFWEDPDGLILASGSIMSPDKIGDWTYFEVNDDGDRFNLFVRHVQCLESYIQDRSRSIAHQEFKVYPNPVSETLSVIVPNPLSEIGIYSINGVFIESKKIKNTQLSIDVSLYHPGLYVIQLKNQNERQNKFFIVQ